MSNTSIITSLLLDDSQGTQPQVLVSSSDLSGTAGERVQVLVSLASAPAASVSVAVGVSGVAGAVVETGAVLTFTPSNYATKQTVVVLLPSVADTVAGNISFSGSGVEAASVALTVKPTVASTSRVTIDPITRIEGHLRIDVDVSGGRISNAWSSATLFRGIEMILAGRDPRDAPLITQRLCGVCTYIHMLTATRCIEDSLKMSVPANARIVRNLLNGAQYLHDHIVHFYHLHALDWVDVIDALNGSPSGAATLAAQSSPKPPAIDYAAVKTRLVGFAQAGQLGPFKNGYWGHSAYKLPADANLLLTAHYLEALKLQARTARLHALLGGKNPHPQSVVVGGVTCGGELGRAEVLNAFKDYLAETQDFIENVYLPDVKLVAAAYPEWASIGGFDNFLAYGEFQLGPSEPADLFFPRGAIFGRDVAHVQDVDVTQISEHVARSWYQGTTAKNPAVGVTQPAPGAFDLDGRYSWSKAPRYKNEPMEVGPLARVLVAYGRGTPEVVAAVDAFLADTGLPVDALFSTLGRVAARALETKVIADAMWIWMEELENNLAGGNTRIFASYGALASKAGVGLNEAPRGAVGHWLKTNASGAIENYQMVVPSAWNLGPRDAAGNKSPVEAALTDAPCADTSKPLEVLRIVHSFDPCIACGVHLIDAETGEENDVKIL